MGVRPERHIKQLGSKPEQEYGTWVWSPNLEDPMHLDVVYELAHKFPLSSLPHFIRALFSPEENVKRNSMHALGAIGKPAVLSLMKVLAQNRGCQSGDRGDGDNNSNQQRQKGPNLHEDVDAELEVDENGVRKDGSERLNHSLSRRHVSRSSRSGQWWLLSMDVWSS